MTMKDDTQPSQTAPSTTSTSDDQSDAETPNLMPVTGENTSAVGRPDPIFVLAILFVICLGAAGIATIFGRKPQGRGMD
jgi:hypothetical protein